MNETRNIYFVRHGQTEANADGVAQSADSQLTPLGKKQAEAVAHRLSDKNIRYVLTSQLSRALDTGMQIARDHATEVTQLEILNERKKPSSIFGLKKSSDQYKNYVEVFLGRASDKDYRYEDGENISDIVARVKELLNYIAHETTGDIAVVTHGIFLRVLVAYILTRSEDMTVYTEAFKNIQFDNTGLTHVKLESMQWRFGTINDSTHLS